MMQDLFLLHIAAIASCTEPHTSRQVVAGKATDKYQVASTVKDAHLLLATIGHLIHTMMFEESAVVLMAREASEVGIPVTDLKHPQTRIIKPTAATIAAVIIIVIRQWHLISIDIQGAA